MIGIVGGVGPYAGGDLFRKILDQTDATTDQGHLSVALLSVPARIADRTEFLLRRTGENPAGAMARVILDLERLGAAVVGIPCNTAHAPEIFKSILGDLRAAGSKVHLVHMIHEVARFLREQLPRVRTVGVLCTTGTHRTQVYPDCLEPEGFRVVLPDERRQQAVQQAIYDGEFGLKARPDPASDAAKEILAGAINALRQSGAEAIVLGCTEIPLAVETDRIDQTAIVDANLVLARALIREAAPEKLKPLEP